MVWLKIVSPRRFSILVAHPLPRHRHDLAEGKSLAARRSEDRRAAFSAWPRTSSTDISRVARARHSYLHDQAFRVGLWADEHSAQLSPQENRRLQDLFSQGIRNVLSATTTMEVGIDIGTRGVLMANMPPGLANYLQRGGRAGRRTDGASIVCTFARRRPYDQAAFDDFQSFFRRELRRANVMLEREGIARF